MAALESAVHAAGLGTRKYFTVASDYDDLTDAADLQRRAADARAVSSVGAASCVGAAPRGPTSRAASVANVAAPLAPLAPPVRAPVGAAQELEIYYKPSWSIQESLDLHASLCQQKDNLSKLGEQRIQERTVQVQCSKIEVQEALERAQQVSIAEACDAGLTQALAARVRRATQQLALAARLRTADEAAIKDTLHLAEQEMEKSRKEMKAMKEAIDDKSLHVATDEQPPPDVRPEDRQWFYCTNCKVGGHGLRFCEYLLKRPNWRIFPYQKWFEDEKHNEYHCPLGKRLVDFADESHFSRLAMYIRGRIWLEDKTKMWELVPDLMPDTYIIEDCKWKGKQPGPDEEQGTLPWFVKEADRNWGTSVMLCSKASQCMSLAKPGATYVVQQHIKDPLLLDDGRKSHIKFYVLLMGMEDGKSWKVYTFKDGYLSISPNKWTPDDLSKETQVTIIRTERIGSWRHWPAAYPKCKAAVAEVVRRGVAQKKLEGRLGKRQFEILSADFIVDTNGDVWLFEFNMSPVLKDPKESPHVHDGDMITAGLNIVIPWEHSDPGLWDLAGEFVGEAPDPAAPKAAAQAPAGGAEAASAAPADAGSEAATSSTPA